MSSDRPMPGSGVTIQWRVRNLGRHERRRAGRHQTKASKVCKQIKSGRQRNGSPVSHPSVSSVNSLTRSASSWIVRRGSMRWTARVSSRSSASPRRIPIPCLDCGALTHTAVYCSAHQRPTLYGWSHQLRSRMIRAQASTCWICGEGPKITDPWAADHIRPGDPTSPLEAAHRSCNSRRGENA